MENNTDNEQLIEDCSKKNKLYKFFENKEFWNNNKGIAIKNTKWKDTHSEKSLSFVCGNDSPREQLKELLSIFAINNENQKVFSNKFLDQLLKGSGNEGKKVMTLHSSSLLSFLCFYHVTKEHPITIPLPVEDSCKKYVFLNSEFEVHNDVTYAYRDNVPNVQSANPSNMDVVLRGNNDGENCVLFLESKFSEYLKNGLVDGISTEVYGTIYKELSDFLKDDNLKCEESGKNTGTFKLRASDGNTRNYLQGIKQMISHFMAVCNYAKEKGHSEEKIFLGTILFHFDDEIVNKECFDNYTKLYGNLMEALKNLVEKYGIHNLILLDKPFTYQQVFSEQNKGFLDTNVASYYKL